MKSKKPPTYSPAGNFLLRILPWCFLALFATEIVVVMLPKKDGEFHVREFGRLPVLLNGRVQPFDSVARNSLLQIRSTGDLPLEQVPSWKFWHHPKKLRSTEWLLELMTRPEVADTRPVFLIHLSELLTQLNLQDKGLEHSGLRYYSFNDLKEDSILRQIERQGQKSSEKKSEEQTAYDKQVVKLANAVMLYHRLKVNLQPEGVDNFAQVVADFQKDLLPAVNAADASEKGKDFDKAAVRKLAEPLRLFQPMADYGYALVVPPASGNSREQWKTAGASLLESIRTREINPALPHLARIASAYRASDASAFNSSVEAYQGYLTPNFAHDLKKGQAEFYFNQVKAFLHATIIYIFAFVLAGGSLVALGLAPNLSESLRRSAFYLVVLGGLVHTFGLVFRMALEGRPPVTNLYSSAIFIGWGTMLAGIILERIYRLGIGSILASLVGFITLLIAHNLALGGDTMEMLRAVLDTNFWLATHVVVITLGYSACFAAGLLAILYVLSGVFTPLLKRKAASGGFEAAAAGPQGSSSARRTAVSPLPGPEIGKVLSKMVYGIVCFATLFSFVGTVLGGIWADQSWGRFWGWDPKENGALLIVLWNAIILHARWGGLVRDRGIMNLAIFGNIVTSFSWFGVNMLGIGLHSYGFMDAAFYWLMLFMASQAAIIAIGLLPLRLWRSFRAAAPASTPPRLPGTRAPAPQPV
jgi:cytochrome c-type biogenesis protein CcsB